MGFEIKVALKWKKATTAMVTFSVGMMKPSEYPNGRCAIFINQKC